MSILASLALGLWICGLASMFSPRVHGATVDGLFVMAHTLFAIASTLSGSVGWALVNAGVVAFLLWAQSGGGGGNEMAPGS